MDNYKGSVTVRSYEADYFGVLTIPALCDQIQDAAWSDARRIDWGLTAHQTWVLARLALEVRGSLPRWAEDYSVETWHRGIEKVVGVRDFEMTTEVNGAVAVATSSWLVIDRDSRRLVRLRGFPEHAPSPSERCVMERSAPRIAKSIWTDQRPFVAVRYDDLDVNRHVNTTMSLLGSSVGVSAKRGSFAAAMARISAGQGCAGRSSGETMIPRTTGTDLVWNIVAEV